MHLAIEAGAMIRSCDGGRTFKDRLPDSPVDPKFQDRVLADTRAFLAAHSK
jgi:hypothetical protein